MTAAHHRSVKAFTALLRDPDFRAGSLDLRQIGLGVAAWGLVTGVAMIKSGLPTHLAVAISLLVFAGSAQLAALPLISAGAPLALVLGAACCVNLRFVVYSAQMRAYLERLPLTRRMLCGYLIGDVVVVLMLRRHPRHDGSPSQLRYYLGCSLTNWAYWQISSSVGLVLANLVPDHWGLGFAGTLALLAVLMGLMRDHGVAAAIVLAGAAATMLFWLPLKLNLVAAIALAVVAGMAWDLWGPARPGEER